MEPIPSGPSGPGIYTVNIDLHWTDGYTCNNTTPTPDPNSTTTATPTLMSGTVPLNVTFTDTSINTLTLVPRKNDYPARRMYIQCSAE